LISPSWAAPALSGYALDGTSIFWSWTPADAASTFTLLTSTGGVIAVFSGTTGSTTEGGLPGGMAIQRELQQFDGVTTTTSPMVMVATPDTSTGVPLAFPATVVGSDNLTRASLAEGALSNPGQLSVSADPVNKPLINTTPALIAEANSRPPVNRSPVPASFREFIALSNGAPFTGVFGAAATLQIPYSDVNNTGSVDGVSPAVPVQSLALYTIDPAQGSWVPVSGAVLDTTNKIFTANVSHFSVYGLFGVAGPSDLSQLRVFPSPWRTGRGGAFDDARGIHFRGLTPAATIRIFTIRGEIVRRIDKQASDGDEVIWDGRNSDGDKAVSGVYFYLVTDPVSGKHVKDRIGIIR